MIAVLRCYGGVRSVLLQVSIEIRMSLRYGLCWDFKEGVVHKPNRRAFPFVASFGRLGNERGAF